MTNERRPKVVVIGAGFGGLSVTQELVGKDVDVLLVDRNNFHTFTPLLYQVATSGLDPSDIAYPVRTLFRRRTNVDFLLGEVINIDYQRRVVCVKYSEDTREEEYDYLVIAAGSVTNFFGNKELEKFAYEIKDLPKAIELRNHILRLFEQAMWTDDPELREAMTTMVVVGGGPTGIETAGALYELYNHVLKQEYNHLRNLDAKVILIEALDTLLIPYPKRLQRSAYKQLESLGVEIMLNAMVEHAALDHITLKDGRTIPTYTLVWAAGVKASPIAELLDVELQKGGRIPITPHLEVIGHEHIYALGDIAHLNSKSEDQPYPQLIPVAQQQGRVVARNILHHIKGEPLETFKYYDKGIMATIGRRRAVAWLFYKIPLSGFLAWVSWLGLHLIWLIGFRNRVSVFINWIWNYLTYDRSVRLILERSVLERPEVQSVAREEEKQDALHAEMAK